MKRILVAAFLFLAHVSAAFACISSDQFLANAERAKIPTTVLVDAQLKLAASLTVAVANIDMEVGFVALSDVPDGSGVVSVGPPGHVCGYMVLQERDYRILRTTLFGRTA